MASHPYISGPGNITQIIGFLRKNFPQSVTSDTVKKYNLASNNESYVINALQFIGLINEECKRTERGQQVLSLHKEEDFQASFADLIREAYKDLFELRGDQAWSLNKLDLIAYFRNADKTSDAIGTRQAAVFRVFAALSGFNDVGDSTKPKISKSKEKTPRSVANKVSPKTRLPLEQNITSNQNGAHTSSRDMAMTVRIEINLPADGTRDVYDNIFKSIRANLINE